MITNFKLFEQKSKGKDIVYTFNTKAKTGKNEYTVHLLATEEKWIESFGKYIFSIDGTPGSWYVSTLLENIDDGRETMSISGDSWLCINWQDLRKELLFILDGDNLDKIGNAKKFKLL